MSAHDRYTEFQQWRALHPLLDSSSELTLEEWWAQRVELGLSLHNTASFRQEHFRLRNDDGTETTATWLALEDTNASMNVDTNYRARFTVYDVGGGALNNVQPQLQYNLAGAGWNDVNLASSVVRSFPSIHFADNANTTSQLTAPSANFITPNSGMDEGDGRAGQNNDIDFVDGVNEYVEVEFCFRILSADVTNGQTLQLRVIEAPSTVFASGYPQIPTITVVEAPALTKTQRSFRVRSGDDQTLNADAGWAAAENVNATMDLEKRFRIRYELEGVTTAVKHQYNINGAGWVDVHTTPLDWTTRTATRRVEAVDSKQYTDGAATTDILTTSTESFTAGEGVEYDNVTGTISAANSHTEVEFTVLLHRYGDAGGGPLALNDGDTIQFRVVESSGTVLAAYTNTPTITVNHPAGLLGGVYPENPGTAGPIEDGNGAKYAVIEDEENSPQFMMVKSTPASGGDIWTEQDGANRPATTDVEGLHLIPDLANDRILVLQYDAAPWFHSFRVSTHPTNPDTWEFTDEDVDVNGAILDQADQQITGGLLSDGRVVAVYTGDQQNPWVRTEVWAAIRSAAAPNAVGTATEGSSTGASSLTYSHTSIAGTNRRIFVGVAWDETGSGQGDITGVTYGGVAMARVSDGTTDAQEFVDITNRTGAEVWSIREADLPADGANDVVITMDQVVDGIVSWCRQYDNVNQAANVAQVVTGEDIDQGSTASLAITPTAGNQTIIAQIAGSTAADWSVAGGPTLIHTESTAGQSGAGAALEQGTAAAVTVEWTGTATQARVAMINIAIEQAGAGSWGTPFQVWDLGTDTHWGVVGVVGDNDHFYVFAVDQSTVAGDLQGKRINGSTEALEDLFGASVTAAQVGTTVDTNVGAGAGERQNHTRPIYFNDGSPKILIGWVDDTTKDGEAVVITVGSGGSVGTVGGAVNDSADIAQDSSSRQPMWDIVRDSNGDFHSFFATESVGGGESTLWHAVSTDDGATWGTDEAVTLRSPKSRINWVRAYIDQAGTAVQLVYDDASGTEQNNDATGGSNTSAVAGLATGFVWYDEYALAAGPVSGGSTSVLTVDGQGAGTKKASGGATATVTIDATGTGEKIGSGSSTALIEVDTQGAGQPTVSGGSTSTVTVDATGSGTKIGQGGSDSVVSVDGQGSGTKKVSGGATASVTVDATGSGSKLASGGSTSVIEVDATGAGTADVPPLTGGSTSVIEVDGQGTGTKVASGGSTSLVTVDTQASGRKTGVGGSDAVLEVDTQGSGTKLGQGGSDSIIVVVTEGEGTEKSFGGSTAIVTVDGQGAGTGLHTGGSDAVIEVDATGTGSKSVSGGSTATITVDATGGGATGINGGSTSVIQVDGQGAGTKSASGGSTSVIEVDGQGDGTKIGAGGSDSTATVDATGEGTKLGQGSSTAIIEVDAQGAGVRADITAGGSTSVITVDSQGSGTKSVSGGSTSIIVVVTEGEGSEKSFGGSTSSVEIDATADGLKVAFGGSSASITVATDADGQKIGIGGSESNITVDAEGGGAATSLSGGSTAIITVDSDGLGTKAADGGSTSVITVDATGSGFADLRNLVWDGDLADPAWSLQLKTSGWSIGRVRE